MLRSLYGVALLGIVLFPWESAAAERLATKTIYVPFIGNVRVAVSAEALAAKGKLRWKQFTKGDNPLIDLPVAKLKPKELTDKERITRTEKRLKYLDPKALKGVSAAITTDAKNLQAAVTKAPAAEKKAIRANIEKLLKLGNKLTAEKLVVRDLSRVEQEVLLSDTGPAWLVCGQDVLTTDNPANRIWDQERDRFLNGHKETLLGVGAIGILPLGTDSKGSQYAIGSTTPVGTGFAVGSRLILTAYHVLEPVIDFSSSSTGPWQAKTDTGGNWRFAISINFGREYKWQKCANANDGREITILGVVARDVEKDVALAITSEKLTVPSLTVARTIDNQIEPEDGVAIVGYPGKDRRIDRTQLRRWLKVPPDGRAKYFVKRFQPGEILAPEADAGKDVENREWIVLHDANTVGGNSGSPMFRLSDGKVVAIHISGMMNTVNYATNILFIEPMLNAAGIFQLSSYEQ